MYFMLKIQSAQTLEQVFLHACISINISYSIVGFGFNHVISIKILKTEFYGGMTLMEYCFVVHYCYLCNTVSSRIACDEDSEENGLARG